MSDVSMPGRAAKTERPDRIRFALDLLERAGLPLLMAAMFAFFAIDSTSGDLFTSSANIKTILGNQAVTGLVALAMVVPLVAGYFDLSVAATTGVANVAAASLLGTHGWPIVPAIIAVLLIGALIGAINGFLVAKLGLSGFVITLGTYTLLGGLVVLYTKGEQITAGIPRSFANWGGEKWLGVPRPFILLMVLAAVTWYGLRQIPFGRYLEAIGSNENAARLVGINVVRKVWMSFIIAGMIAAAAGILVTSRNGIGSPETSNAYLFPSFAAVFLGATTIRPGRYNVWGTMIGVYFVAISVSGFTLLGAETWVQPVFNGTSLVAAVALSTFFARQRDRRARGTLEAEAEMDGAPPALPGERTEHVAKQAE